MVSPGDDYEVGIPDWAYGKWIDCRKAISNVSTSIVRANRAVITLKNHKTMGTYPNSIAVTIKVQVDKAHQTSMDAQVKCATVAFQTQLLDAMLDARTKELQDRKKDLDDIKSKFLTFFTDTLKDLRDEGIYERGDDACNTLVQHIKEIVESTANKIGKELQVSDYFANKEKQEKQEARKAATEERRLNETLTDPAVKELQEKVNSLEKRLKEKPKPEKRKTKKAGTTKPAGQKGKQGPKGKGSLQARAEGPKKGQEKGNRKAKPRSTASTGPSGSKKRT